MLWEYNFTEQVDVNKSEEKELIDLAFSRVLLIRKEKKRKDSQY